mmetsp:Transcript_7554/g.13951  ORF Transcript_7554/g.13951 Transcript_7554/m.13951 type:complete len:1066 (-) Transcript_7554:200-3397(-)
MGCAACRRRRRHEHDEWETDELDVFDNIVLLTDSHKAGQHLLYPPKTEKVYCFFDTLNSKYNDICFFGLQYFLKRYLVGPVITEVKVNQADWYLRIHFSNIWGDDPDIFDRSSWDHILHVHGGHLPLLIKAVPEGTVVQEGNVLFTVENTDPKCFWLTSHIEKLLLQVWYPTTICTQSREQQRIICKYLQETGSDDVVKSGGHLFKLHDFGFSGASSVESAALGGAAHLVNFKSSDMLASLNLAKEYYLEACAGVTFPSTEHSTMTCWGEENQEDAMLNMLNLSPMGIVGVVSDSYDVKRACCEIWGDKLKPLVNGRDGILVLQLSNAGSPDVVFKVLDALESKFGSSQTCTGHRLLPPCVRLFLACTDDHLLHSILACSMKRGWAADNLIFGKDGGALQRVNLGTLGCSLRCSYALVNGVGRDLPQGPNLNRRIHQGRVSLENKGGQWCTVAEGKGAWCRDMLVEVFRDGELLVDDSFAVVRRRAEGHFEAARTSTTSITGSMRLGRLDPQQDNLLMLADSHKVPQHLQYKPGTEIVYSCFETRGGAYHETVFFGLQYILKRYLCGPTVNVYKINEAERFLAMHFSSSWGYNCRLFNRGAWEHIVHVHGGHLPVSIRAVPEGSVVPVRNVLMTIENTDPACYWLPSYLETVLMQVWYPTMACTHSREHMKLISHALAKTGCSDSLQQGIHLFKLSDFGFGHASSVEAAAVGGASHLVSFASTGNAASSLLVAQYYGSECAGFSMPASDSFTTLTWGSDEEEACRKLVEHFPTGIVACKSDTYDACRLCKEYLGGTHLVDEVRQRDGVLLIRLDSESSSSHDVIQVLETLNDKFGHSTTCTGHMQLPPYLQVLFECEDLQGLEQILEEMSSQGWAANNLCFGSSTGLLQKVNQDMVRCAFRCTYTKVQGKDVHVTGGSGADLKHALKSGKVALYMEDGVWTTATQDDDVLSHDQLVEVFCDGKILVEHHFSEIRKRAECRMRLPMGPPCTMPEDTPLEIVLQEETTATSHDAAHLQRDGEAWGEAAVPPIFYTQPMEVTEGCIQYDSDDLEEGCPLDVSPKYRPP